MKTKTQIDQEINNLTLKIKREIDLCSSPVQSTNNFRLPYIIRELIKNKNHLQKIWQRSLNPNDKLRWNQACRQVKRIIEDYKQENWEETIRNLSAHNNSIWRMSKALKNKHETIGPLQGHGSLAFTEKQMTEVLADSLELQFTPHKDPIDLDFTESVIDGIFDLFNANAPSIVKPTSPEEIKNLIKSLNAKKVAGYDGVSYKAIKNLAHKSIILITNIFNSCFRLQYFPNDWKRAIIIVFKKPGKPPLHPSSYRPISLLPCLSKLFEKTIKLRLDEFIKDTHFISPNQYGFISGHSTTHQVQRLVEHITNCFNNKVMVAGCFLDIEKAYDSLWHQGLLKKLFDANFPTGLSTL